MRASFRPSSVSAAMLWREVAPSVARSAPVRRWINRWAANPGIVRRQFRIYPPQVEHRGDLADRVIIRHSIGKTERVKKLPLIVVQPSHHCAPLQKNRPKDTESLFDAALNRLLQQNLPTAEVATQGWKFTFAIKTRHERWLHGTRMHRSGDRRLHDAAPSTPRVAWRVQPNRSAAAA